MLSEYESSLIGAILTDPGLIAELPVNAEDFSSTEARKVWWAVEGLFGSGSPVNLVTVAHSLGDDPSARTFMAEASNNSLSAANAKFYAGHVFSASRRRGLANLCREILEAGKDPATATSDLLDRLDTGLTGLVAKGAESSIVPYRALIGKALSEIEAAYRAKGKLRGLSTGFPKLDRLTQGFHPGEFWVIGARPSEGKTVLGLNMAEDISIRSKTPVAFFSIEMPASSLGIRTIASQKRINASGLTSGMISTTDFTRLSDLVTDTFDAPLYVVDSPSLSLAQLGAYTRRLVRSQGVKVIFVDYLTLLRMNSKIPRHEAVAEASRGLKALARELGISLVVLAQLKRESLGRRPIIADLRESSQIEQDADTILLIHNTPGEEGYADSELIVGKNRNGPQGIVPLQFTKKYLRFDEKAETREEDE